MFQQRLFRSSKTDSAVRPGNLHRGEGIHVHRQVPPQDHPHVYINMGEADTILCPYCATRFRFDPRLTPLDADPPDSFFADHNAV